jgi:hypothetical protein
MAEQFATESSDQGQGQAQPPSGRKSLVAAGIALVGGALSVGALVLVSNGASPASTSSLSVVAVADISAAAQTIDPAVSARLAAEAKNCTVPLAHLTIAKLPGASGGSIRIRSGDYVSPLFQITDVPQQVAIPYPQPYPLGHGAIGIEGTASGAVISLRPEWTLTTLNGSAVRNVVWKPGNPCQ